MLKNIYSLSIGLLCWLLLVPLLQAADHTFITQQAVQQFIHHMTVAHHFKRQQLIAWLKQVQFKPQVLHYLNKPIEKTTWNTYQRLFINTRHIEGGVRFWQQHEAALNKAEKQYGVPASIIVATIGVETRYGNNMGHYRVIDALSNIAFSHSSRAAFFRHELEEFFLLAREENFDPLTIRGSYAGAIGQPQFMPSSYRRFAIRFSKSKQIDLIHNTTNVIGSIANYYHHFGWQINQPVASKMDASQVTVPSLQPTKTRLKTKVITLPNTPEDEYWIGFHNFDVIKRYNASNLYAMAVFQLSHQMTRLRGNDKQHAL